MSMPVSSLISGVEFPPIAEAMSWVRQGPRNRELLNLCQAVPSYPPAPALQEEFARLAATPGIGGYTNIFGLDALRAAHAAAMSKDYKAAISAEHVAITTGCNQAFAAAVMAVAKAGENVVMPAPYYFNHQMWLSMLGIGIRDIPAFSIDANYPDVEKARAAIDDRTRAIVLCTPNNPTGAIYPPEVIAAFYDLARERGLALILDETYKDFRPDPAPAHGLFNFALAELDGWKQEKLEMMAGRLAAIREVFGKPGLKFELVSSGAYFAYVRHPFRGEASKSVAMRLAQEHDVLCLPGSMFGPGQEDYLRFAFANVDGALMQHLVERLMGAQ